MNLTIRNIVAVLSGLVLGSAVNMGIIMVSGHLIPPPNGADVTTMEGLKASMHLFQPKHFLFPFLAHALGTLSGSAITAYVCTDRKTAFSFLIGIIFLAGGIANVFMLPSPIWFAVLDLTGAYIPMSFIAGKIIVQKS
ncbi:hypothetical protein [Leptospira adleri]|uniref:Uncharacterized protein n=1 Tax=Leptospira adleri TaxID=2023186 RepID=A0A2M9YKB4_9LEPT|nr:hypothetical protein [Leptospira adleri]PJZ51971.1 hypothetical protein CH380_17205 [Leptospira adleri]PJZ60762.1 hypothetical protein CH376_16650 [Leptospira adleri]